MDQFPNPFQIEVEQALRTSLEGHAIGNIQTDIDLGDDSFLKITILPREVAFYIYADGAQILGQGIDQRFEIEDYDSLESLKLAFLDAVRSIV